MQEFQENAQLKEEKVYPISISSIVPNPNQPRKSFSMESILKLADSIKQFGIIQPLTIRKVADYYELVSGERRLRAAKELNMTFVPCIITNINEEKSAEISIIENLIREDLNIFEQALAIETLIDTYNLTQEQVAKKLSNSQSFIANKLRLLRLSEEERKVILASKLSERHARALLRIYDENTRKEILYRIVNEGLNVAKSEELVDSIINNTQTSSAQSESKGENSHIASKESQKDEKDTKTYKDTESFYFAIKRALESAKASNLEIKSRKVVSDTFTEITIIIPTQPKES